MDVNLLLALVAIARRREVDWSVLGAQNWFLYEFVDGALIIVGDAAQLKRVISDGTDEGGHDGEEVWRIYCK